MSCDPILHGCVNESTQRRLISMHTYHNITNSAATCDAYSRAESHNPDIRIAGILRSHPPSFHQKERFTHRVFQERIHGEIGEEQSIARSDLDLVCEVPNVRFVRE